jgi:exodeoxyribonuclease-3
MKIITWNVNGLRAVLNKGALDWIHTQKADVVCLQEIKARPDQLSEDHLGQFNGFRTYWNPAERPGYSGVVSLTQNEPVEVQNGIGSPEFDTEGRVVRSRHTGFLLYNIYFPNGGRGLDRLAFKLKFYEHLLEICDQLHADGERIILCGDFNTSHKEIDLRNPKENVTTSGFMPEEREWIDRYLEHGFVDAYRAIYPERVQYTWWTYRFGARRRNIGWRLDYFLVSAELMDHVKDVVIHEEVEGSDHCPVSLEISL